MNWRLAAGARARGVRIQLVVVCKFCGTPRARAPAASPLPSSRVKRADREWVALCLLTG